ncbi:outer membrane receptor protein involved in Fe transport [Sphingomonas naasensis]|nr:TonB-dependent receptor [Sphingomonas naasensis]NIJ20329.1 outer membrane receptor protein involved in Fe transport [Sphingomonas naasensis]
MSKYACASSSFALGVMLSALIASSASAQVAEPGAQEASAQTPGEDEAIVVTGTRIRRPDLQSNSPITVVGSEEIRFQGATAVEGVLNRLPQFTADANDNVSNGSDGTANINLRNLGSNRVLTLINGQRMLPSQAIDINFVPSALIERIDVVTGGASAVYGSDALSGVVNFILRDHLDGIRIDAQAGFAQHGNNNRDVRSIIAAQGYAVPARGVVDGGKQDINIALGKNFAGGRGNITLYGGYRHADPVLQANRDVSACALQAADATGTRLNCGGSSNTPYGSFTPLGGPNQGIGLTNAKDGSRTWVPYDSSFAYNYAPTNYFQRSDERYTGGAFAKFEIVPAAEAYGSFMYMKDHTFSQAAPSALFLGTPFTLPCNQPLMSASQLAALCGAAAGTSATQDTLIGYRLGGNGTLPRRDDLRHEDFRYTAGLRGDLGHGFSYDAAFVHSLVRFDETYMNNVDNEKAQRALDVVSVGGVPTCRSVIDGTDPACTPINVFQANGLTGEQAAYLYTPSNTASRNTQTIFNLSVSGDLGTFGIRSPWAESGVAIVVGAEHRKETLRYTADDIAEQGGAADSDGKISVTEGFGEIEIPILQNLPFAHALTLNGGMRYSSYRNEQESTGLGSKYTAFTYKGEVTWAPIRDVRLRASYNRAIRAPNIGELFGAQTIGNVAAQDPCSGTTPAASAAICGLTGVSAAQYGHIIECPSDVCSAQGGGNPALRPEKGDTWTVGLVVTPKMVPGLSFSVDYYNIKVKNYISTVDPSLTISQCVATSDPYYCGLFRRDPRSGALFGTDGYIISTTLNTGFLKTSGIDVTADYSLPMGALGKLDFNLVGTWLNEQVSEPLPGLGTYDCKGLYGYTCGQPSPTWRHVLRTTWQVPGDASLSMAWRYLGGTELSSLSTNPFLAGTPSVVNAKIPAYSYFDLTAAISVTDQFQFRAGVNNLLDKDPPAIAAGILSAFGNGNTYPGVYDPLGRTVFFGVSVNF